MSGDVNEGLVLMEHAAITVNINQCCGCWHHLLMPSIIDNNKTMTSINVVASTSMTMILIAMLMETMMKMIIENVRQQQKQQRHNSKKMNEPKQCQ